MEQVIVKPTWRLAWGLWWRMALINLGIAGIIVGIVFALGFFMLGSLLGPLFGGW